MNDKIGVFCEIIEFLHQSHARWTRDPHAASKQRKLNDTIIKTSYNVVEHGKLKDILETIKAKGTIDFPSGRDFLFLKPPDKENTLPVLSMTGDLNKDNISIRMALFTFDRSEKVSALGFRFETPHGVGRHNYHHAQMFKSFDKGVRELPNVPSWLPESQPALMMSAMNPMSLFLGVLIGLYGLDKIEQEWQGQSFTGHLKGDLDALKRGCGAP